MNRTSIATLWILGIFAALSGAVYFAGTPQDTEAKFQLNNSGNKLEQITLENCKDRNKTTFFMDGKKYCIEPGNPPALKNYDECNCSGYSLQSLPYVPNEPIVNSP